MASESDVPAQKVEKKTLTEEGEVRCAFSSMEKTKVGTGTTTRTHIVKQYWYVEQVEDERYSIRRINEKNVPFGDEQVISQKALLEKYLPEIDFWEETALPAMNELEGHLEDGEDELEAKRYYSSRTSLNHALAFEEKNVRALFNLGILYTEIEDIDKAKDMMGELLKIKASFAGKNQYLFNNFGISLRKSSLYEEAITYYSKALEFITDDDHLYYNLARAHFELGNWEECVKALLKCKDINPGLDAIKQLAELLKKLADSPKLCKQNGRKPVPKHVADDLFSLLRVSGGSTTSAAESNAATGGPKKRGPQKPLYDCNF